MSQADELLNSLSEGSSEVTTESGNVVIGSDRFITVPDSLKKIAVQYDHNVETVTFDCPRYWDSVDLSTMKIYVNYLRSDGKGGTQLCTNVAVDDLDDSIMHFDWVISGNVTEIAGNLTFLVCIKNTDASGNEINHWNSELCTETYVSTGLKCMDTIVRRYPDIITQMLLKMEEVNALFEQVVDLVTPEALEQYIGEYMDANPIGTDETLTQSGQAADAAITGTRIAELTNLIEAYEEELSSKIPTSDKGIAGGVATLNEEGKLESDQLPEGVYELSGTAEAKVAEHNASEEAHADIRTAVSDVATVVGNAQITAQTALDTAGSKASTELYTVEVPLSWTEDVDNGGYIQTIAVGGIVAEDVPIADVVLGADITANDAYIGAWRRITRITTDTNSITLWANAFAPESAFSIQLRVVR